MSRQSGDRKAFHFQFVTTPTNDTPGTALYLHFNNKRYLFGRMAEGTQRACIGRGIGLKSVQNVFLSGKMSWSNHGGLVGMILTVSDTHSQSGNRKTEEKFPPLHIHGAPGLAHTLACARRFVFRTGMPLSTEETFPGEPCTLNDPTWSDENIRVWAIPVMPTADSVSPSSERFDASIESDLSDSLDGETPLSDVHETVNLTLSEPANQSYGDTKLPNAQGLADSSKEKNQIIRKSIVTDMFNSDWHRDRLVEVPFSKVKFPAIFFLRDPKQKELLSFRGDAAESYPHIHPSTMVFVRTPWPASLVRDLPPANDLTKQVALSYIVRGHSQRGRFLAVKAMDLGVKPGPAFAKLTSGHPIELADGSVVTPDMVLEPSKPGRGVAILDIPGPSYHKHLFSRPEWKDTRLMEGIESMVWITSYPISQDVKRFMKSLSPNIQHIWSSRARSDSDYLAFESSASSAIRLSRIWGNVFPVPIRFGGPSDYSASRNIGTPEEANSNSDSRLDNLVAERGLRIQVEPTFELLRTDVPPVLSQSALTKSVLKSVPRHVCDLADAARVEVSQLSLPAEANPEPLIITLGTGSAAPSKYRNVSSTLLRLPDQGSYLFDCGENTLGQLLRVFGRNDADEVLKDLRMIWISHLHADHHLGTISILKRVNSLRRQMRLEGIDLTKVPPLFVVGEENMVEFLDDYNSLSNISECVEGVIASPTGMKTSNGLSFTFKDHGVPIKQLQSCNVSHCAGAQAVSVTFENGFKFSYSGDCRPSEKFAKIGAQSDVLVHEATFDDGLEGDAMAKKHCTTGEALAVAAKMGAKNVILTHFSQRYQKIPVMSDIKLPEMVRFEEGSNSDSTITGPVDEALDGFQAATTSDESNAADTASLDALIAQNLDPESIPPLDMNVCVAFDYMSIRVSQIKQMQKFVPALQALFEVEFTQPEETMTKAQQKSMAQLRDREKERTDVMVETNGDAKEIKTQSKRQRRMEQGRVRYEENMKNGAKREQSARADRSPDTREEKKRRSDEVAVPPGLLPESLHGNGGATKDAMG